MNTRMFLLVLMLFPFGVIAQENISFSSVYRSFEVDESPQYPYGKDSLEKYLRNGLQNINVSVCHGTAMVSFVVETDGSLSNFKTIRQVCPEVDQKLLELVKKMPLWKPGKKSGFPVRTEVNIPFVIKVEKIKISN